MKNDMLKFPWILISLVISIVFTLALATAAIVDPSIITVAVFIAEVCILLVWYVRIALEYYTAAQLQILEMKLDEKHRRRRNRERVYKT